MNNSKRRAAITAWGLVILAGLTAAACGSPNWQNQYTREEANDPAAADGDGSGVADDAGDGACEAGSPNCNSTLSSPPPAPSPAPSPGTDPQGNPDPVPWAIDVALTPRKTQ